MFPTLESRHKQNLIKMDYLGKKFKNVKNYAFP